MTHRLLLVEDSALQAELLRDDLVEAGYDVTVAHDGEEALRHLEEHRPDAIVSDVMMPGITGYELCRRVKSDRARADIPVLLLTTLRDPIDIVRGLEAGADNFLRKPYDLEQLLNRLETVLRVDERPSEGRFRMGVEVLLLGHTFTVTADRQQILDMLMSSFEDLIHTNQRLRDREQELQQARDELTSQVEVSEDQRRQLGEKERELRHTLEAARVATWRLRLPEGRFEWSDNAHALFGLPPGTAIDRMDDWLELVHEDDRELLGELTGGLMSPDGPELPDEWQFRLTGADGMLRTFSVRGEVGQDADGRPAVTGVAIDDTQRRQLEDELRDREQMLSGILAASPDAIVVTEADGRIRFASERVRDIIGLDAAAMIGRDPRDFITEGLSATFPGTTRDEDGEGLRDRVRLGVRHVDGHTVTVDVRVGELRGYDGTLDGYVAVVRDVTERARLEADLAEAKEAADAANRAKSEYLSRMSHELRTPMNTVLGFSQLLQLSDLSPDDQDNVGRILRAGRHLLALIDDVLDIARIEAGGVQLSLEPVDVHEVIRGAAELVQQQAGERDVRLALPEGEPGEECVRADPRRLSQVLINLLSNAVKYNRPGGEIHISCEDVGDDRRIAVSDTGYGMEADELERLFTPFDRLGADRTQVTGTGLGLALSKSLIDVMGGRIGCESEPGEGSTFWVELPAAEAARPGRGDVDRDEAADPAAPRHVDGTVLYIEDNPMNIDLVRRVLARGGDIELLEATTAEEGIRLAHERRPDLVLLDLHLVSGTGRQVLATLRDDPGTRDLTIVIVSADATTTSTEELLTAGADGYLTKPFELAELRSLVARTLGGGR